MSQNIKIALDAMGGDHGVSVVVAAALSYLKSDASCELILVGNEDEIKKALPGGEYPPRLSFHPASQTVEMDEKPAHALRHKKDSSMRVSINLVKQGVADACVSAGNTGALMSTARFVLKTIPHIDRPAIVSLLPGVHGHTWVLDLGANVDCEAEHLYQFAVMGNELVSAVDGVKNPKVGLLNIGQEDMKGNEVVQQAHELLNEGDFNYIGFVEGNDVFLHPDLDLVVTDGFVGNVALKTTEGVAKMFTTFLRAEFKRNWLTKLAAIAAMPVLNSLRRRFDPRRYNGACFIGLRGIVVKSHGGADALAFANAITIAKEEAESGLVTRISERVEAQMNTQELSKG